MRKIEPRALTPLQMDELRTMGLDCRDASMYWIQEDDNDVYSLHLCPLEYAELNVSILSHPIPAYSLQDLTRKFPSGTVVKSPCCSSDRWFIYRGDLNNSSKSFGLADFDVLTAAFVYLKECIRRGLVRTCSEYVLTPDVKRSLLKEAEQSFKKMMWDGGADVKLPSSLDERIKLAYKKQCVADVEREIESIHLEKNGNGLVDGMLRYEEQDV